MNGRSKCSDRSSLRYFRAKISHINTTGCSTPQILRQSQGSFPGAQHPCPQEQDRFGKSTFSIGSPALGSLPNGTYHFCASDINSFSDDSIFLYYSTPRPVCQAFSAFFYDPCAFGDKKSIFLAIMLQKSAESNGASACFGACKRATAWRYSV